MDSRRLRCLLISDFNSANFGGFLKNDEEYPRVEPLAGDLAQVFPILTDSQHPVWASQPEVAILWTRPEAAVPSFRRSLEHEPHSPEEIVAEVDRFCAAIAGAASRVSAVLVPTWVVDPVWRGPGMVDYREGMGVSLTLARMNLRLAENLARHSNTFVLNADRWVARCGPDAFAPKLWYQAKVPFGPSLFREAVREVKAALRGLRGAARKLVILDLDETLWGGAVGELGWEKLRLGGHDPVGEAFVDFQRALKAVSRRGVLLGIVSKNEEALALEAIDRHPEMQLRRDDFAGWRINWDDKARNVADLASELNLGLQSVVFVDDHPLERARVREALPEVLVPEWPDNAMLYKRALLGLACFDSPHLTDEDFRRTELYVSERKRNQARQVQSSEEWLKGLDLRVTIEELAPANLPRAAQLFNKTNQMNLSTRRLSERDLEVWAKQPGNRTWVVRAKDKYDDSGLTGLTSLSMSGNEARIVDYVVSCRALGRRIEETMVAWLVSEARKAGVATVRAEYLPTPKNRPCLEFWRRSGFARQGEHLFVWDASKAYPFPEWVTLQTGLDSMSPSLPVSSAVF